MMCDGCKALADKSRVTGRSYNHLKKGKPHCNDPSTCTCQHRSRKDGFLKKET